MLKKKFRNKKIAPKLLEFKNNVKPRSENHRVMHVILQCIPIPVLLKINPNGRTVISLSIQKNVTMKSMYKIISEYLQTNLEIQGYQYMMKSSKMMISDQNHQTFLCNDPEVFE